MKKLNNWWVTDDELDNGISHWDGDSWQNHMSEFTTNYFVPDTRRRRMCLDIGANIGQSALGLYKYFNKVHSFEPGKDFFNCLKRNVKDNNISNVFVHNIGLSDSDGTLWHKEFKSKGGTSRFMSPEEVAKRHHERATDLYTFHKTRVTTLDSYKFKYVDLIKIDVEGWEPYVLRGGINTISEWKPTIVAEWHSKKEQSELDEILEPLGYIKVYKRRSDWYYVHVTKIMPVVTKLVEHHPHASHHAFWKLLGI